MTNNFVWNSTETLKIIFGYTGFSFCVVRCVFYNYCWNQHDMGLFSFFCCCFWRYIFSHLSRNISPQVVCCLIFRKCCSPSYDIFSNFVTAAAFFMFLLHVVNNLFFFISEIQHWLKNQDQRYSKQISFTCTTDISKYKPKYFKFYIKSTRICVQCVCVSMCLSHTALIGCWRYPLTK